MGPIAAIAAPSTELPVCPNRRVDRRLGFRCAIGFLLWLVAMGVLAPRPAVASDRLLMVEQLVEQGQAAEALQLLERMIDGKPNADELALRGIARIMLGELSSGGADLEKAVKLDPTQRQAWMNLAGLEIAEGKYKEALGFLEKAHALDRNAPDGHLNLGAVLVMLGRSSEAKGYFDRYLELSGTSAEAHYLVAVNYALGGLEHLAIEALSSAIALDERVRLRARRDDRFLGLDSLDYRVLLHSDDYVPPPDHHQISAAFSARYEMRDNRLLFAVLDALKNADVSYDPEIETTAKWAIIWGDDLRLKIYNQENGTGVVALSSPKSRYTAEQWQRLTQSLFRSIHQRLGGT